VKALIVYIDRGGEQKVSDNEHVRQVIKLTKKKGKKNLGENLG
jgi:hypothetical protein